MDFIIDFIKWMASAVLLTLLFLFWITICEFIMKKYMGINKSEDLFFCTALATGGIILVIAMIIA